MDVPSTKNELQEQHAQTPPQIRCKIHSTNPGKNIPNIFSYVLMFSFKQLF